MAALLRDDEGTTVVGVLIMPVLALALGAVLHLGLYLLARQTTITAVQEGLTVATAADTLTPAEGETIARQLIDAHSAAEPLALTTTSTATGSVTMTATVRAPGLVPGLPRTVTVTQSAVQETFLTAP